MNPLQTIPQALACLTRENRVEFEIVRACWSVMERTRAYLIKYEHV